MKKLGLFALLAGILSLAGLLFAGESVTKQKYEVVCMKCMAHHSVMGDKGGHGEKHAACAMKCSVSGTDLGLMDEKGNLYMPIDSNFQSARDAIKDKAGQTVELSGTIIKTKGVNYLQLADSTDKGSEAKN